MVNCGAIYFALYERDIKLPLCQLLKYPKLFFTLVDI